MLNKLELLYHDLLLKIEFIMSCCQKDKETYVDDIKYLFSKRLYISHEEVLIVFNKNNDNSILGLFENELPLSQLYNKNFEDYKFVLLKESGKFSFFPNTLFFEECIIPMIYNLFYNLLKEQNLTEKDFYKDYVFSPDYQINLINNLFGLTREQALLYLFSSPKINDFILINKTIDCGNLTYVEPKEVNTYFDVYLSTNNYIENQSSNYSVDSLKQEWYNASQELLNLINTNHPLIKFREQDQSNIIKFKEWLTNMKVAN